MRFVFFVYILALILFSIFTYSFVDINLSYFQNLYTGLYLNQRYLLTVIYLLLILILYVCFYSFIKNADHLNSKLKKIIIIVIFSTIFSYPAALTFDIFNYMTTAKVTYFYQENPYIVYPIEFLNDPYLAFTRAANKTALYGPFWILLTGIPYFLGFGNFILSLFSFKTFIALFYVGTVYLIRRIDKTAALLFALNPLVIIESLVSGHNDIVMIFFAIAAFYLVRRQKTISMLSLFVSILIKFATVFLIPVYLLRFFNKIDKEKMYKYSAFSMFIIFLLSPLREELYPWYAIWFISFAAFLYKNHFLQKIILIFSLGLSLRYIPYMATGNYFGTTPIIRNVLMITPVILFLIFTWLKKYFQSR